MTNEARISAEHAGASPAGAEQPSARAGLCERGRTCPRNADVVMTFGRGHRVRVRYFCEPCAADARVIFGSDVTGERALGVTWPTTTGEVRDA